MLMADIYQEQSSRDTANLRNTTQYFFHFFFITAQGEFFLFGKAFCTTVVEHFFDALHFLYAFAYGIKVGKHTTQPAFGSTFALSAGYHDAFYDKARRARALIGRDFEQAWAHCDVLATPTAPTPAFRLGEKLSDPLAMYLADVFTVPANLAGLPAISVPCGFSTGGLPIGLQLTGPALGETLLLQAARLYERETDWHTRRPPV